MTAGCSGKPLVAKLGVKPGSTLALVGAPESAELPVDGVASAIWPTEDVIRDLALAAGMVDTKVCAIDETWSGLRLTLRRS